MQPRLSPFSTLGDGRGIFCDGDRDNLALYFRIAPRDELSQMLEEKGLVV